MRPPMHDDPNAIPRNGTDVPWIELDDPSHAGARTRGTHQRLADGAASTAGDRRQRR